MHIICCSCGERYPVNTRKWVCRRCGGLFELADVPQFDPSKIDAGNASLWRYRALLPLPEDVTPITMGEGFTPLVETQLDGRPLHAKLDFMTPSGSFKDRGTTVLVSAIKAFGFQQVVEDSSGNAAASLSAYAARAGMQARIFCPAHASPAKLAQIEVYGAQLARIEGPRENAALMVQQAARQGDGYYASHYYNPFALAGMQTTAWEIWEQLGRRGPEAVIAPVGHGTNLLGLVRGFQSLCAAGLLDRLPRFYAAQAENVAPLVRAFRSGLDAQMAALANVAEAEKKSMVERAWDVALDAAGQGASARTIAEGIAINRPVHARELLRAIRDSGGASVAVSEDEIARARNDLARVGLYIEPTSATAVAALRRLRAQEPVDGITVVTLTGSGLKSGMKSDG